jgi:integrase
MPPPSIFLSYRRADTPPSPAASTPKMIKPDDFIFVPLNSNASRLPSYSAQIRSISSQNPLTARSIDNLVKKYACLASLDPSHITVHTLRHTAAMLRKEAGDDLVYFSSPISLMVQTKFHS